MGVTGCDMKGAPSVLHKIAEKQPQQAAWVSVVFRGYVWRILPGMGVWGSFSWEKSSKFTKPQFLYAANVPPTHGLLCTQLWQQVLLPKLLERVLGASLKQGYWCSCRYIQPDMSVCVPVVSLSHLRHAMTLSTSPRNRLEQDSSKLHLLRQR